MRVLIILFISSLMIKCSNTSTSLEGLWIDPKQNIGFKFFSDSLITWNYTTCCLINKYHYKIINNSNLEVTPSKLNPFDFDMDKFNSRYDFSSDTLSIDFGVNHFKLLKSDFNNYYDHFVNDDSTQIQLPTTSFVTRDDILNKSLHIFIGRDPSGLEIIKINDKYMYNVNQVDTFIIDYKNELNEWEVPFCKLFVDKSINFGFVYEVQKRLIEFDLRRVLYVTKGSDHNDYDSYFGGLKLMLRKNNITLANNL